MQEELLTILSLIFAITTVFVAVGLGWCIVYLLVLRRFRFVRELVNGKENSNVEELRIARSKVRRVRRD